jgi:hypothetical protein
MPEPERVSLAEAAAHLRALLAGATTPTAPIEGWWGEIEALLAAAAHVRALLAPHDAETVTIEFWREEVEALLAAADRVLAEPRK